VRLADDLPAQQSDAGRDPAEAHGAFRGWYSEIEADESDSGGVHMNSTMLFIRR